MQIASQTWIGKKPMATLLTAPQYLLEGEPLMIECWTCTRKKEISSQSYRAGKHFFLTEVATAIGWIAAMDFKRERVLAFCCEGCMEKAKAKNGFFRATRPR